MQIPRRAGWLLAGMLGFSLIVGAQQQQQPAPQPKETPKPAKKVKKVWTQDDLAGIRKPSDEYVDQKAAAEAAAKAAAEEKPVEETSKPEPIVDPVTGKPYLDPDSLEGLQEQLRRWEESVPATEQLISEARSRLAQTNEQERWESAKLELDTLEQNLLETRRRIEELKARIAAMKPPAKGATPQTPPTKPPSA